MIARILHEVLKARQGKLRKEMLKARKDIGYSYFLRYLLTFMICFVEAIHRERYKSVTFSAGDKCQVRVILVCHQSSETATLA